MNILDEIVEHLPYNKEQLAIANLEQFIKDCGIEGLRSVRLDDESGFCWLLWKDNRCCVVEIFGYPLWRYRWLSNNQPIQGRPRIYVDGASWLWKFAVDSVRDRLQKEEHLVE